MRLSSLVVCLCDVIALVKSRLRAYALLVGGSLAEHHGNVILSRRAAEAKNLFSRRGCPRDSSACGLRMTVNARSPIKPKRKTEPLLHFSRICDPWPPVLRSAPDEGRFNCVNKPALRYFFFVGGVVHAGTCAWQRYELSGVIAYSLDETREPLSVHTDSSTPRPFPSSRLSHASTNSSQGC